MIVAGIDPSLTNTGIAILKDGQPLHLAKEGWSEGGGASDMDRHTRVMKLRTRINKHLTTRQPDLVVMERPAYAQNVGSACDRHFLWHALLNAITEGGYRYAGIAPTSRASFATGKNHGTKRQVIDATTQWWPHLHRTLQNDNIADALVLATMGALWAGDPVPFEVKDRHRARLEAVAWPVIA